jgi:hypothetical protein
MEGHKRFENGQQRSGLSRLNDEAGPVFANDRAVSRQLELAWNSHCLIPTVFE